MVRFLSHHYYSDYNNSLLYLSIGRNIESENNEFSSTENLRIGKNVSNLSWLNLYYDNKLSQIVSEVPTPPLIGNVTNEQYENIKLFIPSQYKTNYENDTTWKFFTKIVGSDTPFEEYQVTVNPSELTINVNEDLAVNLNTTPQIDSNIIFYFDNNFNEENKSDILNTRYPNEKQIYGVNPGEADVIFMLPMNTKQTKCHVKVQQPATNIILNKTKLTLQRGETTTIYANVEPINAIDTTVTWHSTHDSIATVKNGTITAISGGECDIIATTHNGLEAKCHISVLVSAESINLNETEKTIFIGDSFILTADITPTDVFPPVDIVWSSSNTNVVTIDNGLINAVGLGDAIISATTSNGLTAVCIIKVLPILVESIKVTPYIIEAEVGTEQQLTAEIFPENATNKKILWTVNNPEIASINDYGLLKILKPGISIVTATATDGSGISGNCQIVGLAGIEKLLIDHKQWDLYSSSGILIKKSISKKEIEQLPSAFYILSNGMYSIKFIKK